MSFGPRQIQSSDFLNKKFVKGCFSNLNNPFFISHIQNKGRDISPFRKYNNIKKQKQNSLSKKNESDLNSSLTKTPNVYRNKSPFSSPFNRINNKSKSPFQNGNISSSSSSKNNKNLSKLSFSPNISQRNDYSPNPAKKINRIYKTPKNIPNRAKSNNLKKIFKSPNQTKNNLNISTNNSSNLYKNKQKRTSTPIPRSNYSLHNQNNKITHIKNNSKSPNNYKNKNGLNTLNYSKTNNSFYNNIKASQNLKNNHYSNNFKSKNIFKVPIKSKAPTIITMNINQEENNLNMIINQSDNIEEESNKNIINQNQNINKNKNEIQNQNINKNKIESQIQNHIQNTPENSNNNSEENSKKIINLPNQNPINTLSFKNSNTNFNKEEIKPITKRILCMHEFTKTGYAGEDEKKVNQDNYFVFHNFLNSVKNIFMGVCDGHGQVGQEVSGFLKENLPTDLNKAIKISKLNIIKDDVSHIISETFLEENYKLCTNEMINSMLSGSTCVSLIYTPSKIITANVGDSRAFMGKLTNGKWKSLDLTRDHKPSLPDESNRILSKGGRIEPMRDDDDSFIGPLRVWLKDEDYPGLAMSRSFGDRVAHSVGVCTDPEIREYYFEKDDKFFVISSDGLFEFISSQDIVDIVKDFYISGDIVSCCEYLYKVASEKWMKEEEVIDDITMIIAFLEDEES